MPEKFIEVKEVNLKNNCPVCYSNEHLQITFYQKIKESKLYKWLTSEVKNEMTCANCESTIYPVQWTDDIERVYDYHRKAFHPNKSTFRLKVLGWVVIVFVAIVLVGVGFTLFYSKL
ncbi:hypothetical protein [Gaetbulibacter aestuarii]|uniref:Uncharacterized protein n=1 Tax=Gaetbulibacter aestuarii TaxID=1502358 RepID=A0ABW7MVW0_9FLAO